jgi:hypothetical protein
LILEGVKMMETSPFLAVGAGALAFVLLSYERIPAMLVLLGVGVVSAVAWEPTLMQELAQISFRPRLPEFALTQLGWQDLVTGVVVLGLPQVGLTLGNARDEQADEQGWQEEQIQPVRQIARAEDGMVHQILSIG